MSMIRLFALLMFVFGAAAARADLIVEDEKITDIRVGPWGTESFAIKTTDDGNTTNDEDNCVNQWVIFNRSSFPSDGSYDRAYAMALSAMSSNKLIIVDSASGVACNAANTIGIIP